MISCKLVIRINLNKKSFLLYRYNRLPLQGAQSNINQAQSKMWIWNSPTRGKIRNKKFFFVVHGLSTHSLRNHFYLVLRFTLTKFNFKIFASCTELTPPPFKFHPSPWNLPSPPLSNSYSLTSNLPPPL